MFYSNIPNKFIQSYTSIIIDGVQPVKFYNDAEVSKPNIIKDFKNNTIIYMWYNKVTGKVYIGSGWICSNCLNSYFWISVLNSTKNKVASLIIY